MIITRTPFRVSFVGGGTDVPWFYEQYGGCVISTSINQYMYLTGHPTFNESEFVIKYSKIEITSNLEEIENEIAREILRESKVVGIDISSIPDIPAGTGLGSSSAYAVGLYNLINRFKGHDLDVKRLAELACHLELEILGNPIGKQDQYACAYGGFNFINFSKDNSVNVVPISLSENDLQWLNNSLLLVRVGGIRSASKILSIQKDHAKDDKQVLEALLELKSLTENCLRMICSDITEIANVVNRAWEIKRSLGSHVSTEEIDQIISKAKKNGALAGKLLGAGGSGFILLICPKGSKQRVINQLSPLKILDINLDTTGSKIIYGKGQ